MARVLEANYPRDPSATLAHIRRLVRPGNLPEHLRPAETNTASPRTIYLVIPAPLPPREDVERVFSPYAPASPPKDGQEDSPRPLNIRTVPIPMQPPLTKKQAEEWTRTLWPVTFNAAFRPASYSTPPHILAETKASVESHAGLYLSLAKVMGEEARSSKRGRGIGAVVVDPQIMAANHDEPLAAVVAAAGDARFCPDTPLRGNPISETDAPYDLNEEARPDYHALMRAVSMVSNKRLRMNNSSSSDASDSASAPQSQPSSPAPTMFPSLTSLESHFFEPSNLVEVSQGGYLCNSLDIYITHEPCVCCAMGMLLSRFRTIIVCNDGMRRGTGMSSLDAIKGYGLHWREELNWRAIGFEFITASGEHSADSNEADHVDFHA